MVLSGILFKDLLISTNGLAYILNALMFSICSLTIGFFIGNITQNKNAIGGIVDVYKRQVYISSFLNINIDRCHVKLDLTI